LFVDGFTNENLSVFNFVDFQKFYKNKNLFPKNTIPPSGDIISSSGETGFDTPAKKFIELWYMFLATSKNKKI